MKKLIISMMLLVACSVFVKSQHIAESVKFNNLEWQKCQYEVESNFTGRWIVIKTIEEQRYEFDYIKSYGNWLEGKAVNADAEEVYIRMYFLPECTLMVIELETGVIIRYLID